MKKADKTDKKQILKRAKEFFREVIAPNHLKNLKKLSSLSNFNYNPFLLNYLATFLEGKSDPKSMAKVLIYPRILGTSISTSFGQNIQKFCSEVLPGYGSAVSGIDIEFYDQIDRRKKYAQIKAGPNTINKDDVETVKSHFISIKNLARTNNLKLRYDDLIVGVLYGETTELSANYKQLNRDYKVITGKDFWHRLTGDISFYYDMIDAFGEVAEETDAKDLLEDTISKLSEEIKERIVENIK